MSLMKIILPQNDGNYVFDGENWVLEGPTSKTVDDHAKVAELWAQVMLPASHVVAVRPIKVGRDDGDHLG